MKKKEDKEILNQQDTAIRPSDPDAPSWKMSEELKVLVKQKFAEFYRPTEVQEWLLNEHNLSIHISNIMRYRDRNLDDIKKIRETLRGKISEIPVSNKYYRQKIRQRLVDDLLDNLWIEVPVMDKNGNMQKDDDGNVITKKVQKGNHSVVAQVLRDAMEEMAEFGGEEGGVLDFYQHFLKLRGKEFDEFVMFGKFKTD